MSARVEWKSLLVVALITPVLVNCGKSRYEQVTSKIDPTLQQRTVTPEPHGTADEQPVPPQPAKPSQPGGDPLPPVTTLPTPKLPKPPHTKIPVKNGDWMDPSRYPHGGSTGNTQPPVVIRPPVITQPPVVIKPPVITQPVSDCLTCFKAEWIQPRQAETQKLDILFVIDTSDSIFHERDAAAAEIDQLIQKLPAGVDYNIGVILAQSSVTHMDGELYRSLANEPVVLKSSTMSLEQIRGGLHAKLTQYKGDRSSDGGELGMYSLMHAMQGNTMTRNLNLGMFRFDAGLAVVFIADENDICSLGSYPKGVTPKPDPNHAEIPAFKRFCKGITAESVYNRVLQVKSEKTVYVPGTNIEQKIIKPVLISALVYTNPATVPNNPQIEKWASENEVGYGYLDMVRLNNGVAIDMLNGDARAALARIGQATSQKLQMKTEFTVKAPGKVDVRSICVLVDDREVAWNFDHRTNQIQIADMGDANSKIEYFYCTENAAGKAGPEKYRTMQIDPRCAGVRQRISQP